MHRNSSHVPVLLTILCILVAAPYLHIVFATVRGRPVAPLDDAYITLQYARQIAHGHFYRYNAQDPPTTGMTSLGYGLLMAALYKVGARGESLVGVSVTIGMLWFIASVWLTYRLTQRLLYQRSQKRRWALLAALLVALSGAVQWGFLNGMETGLFTTVTLAAVLAFVSDRPAWAALWLSIAGLTRPEGLLLTGIIFGVTLFHDLWRHHRPCWRPLFLLFVAILPGLLPSLVNWMLTGSPSATGFLAKAWIYNVPAQPQAIAHSMALAYRDILLGSFFGWDAPVPGFTPVGLFLFMLPLWWFLGQDRRWKPLLATGFWFFGAALAGAALITATWHVGRYQVPLVPVAFSLAAGSLAQLESRSTRTWQRVALSLCALYLIGSSLHAIPDFFALYRRSTRTMANQQLVLADWMREQLPREVRVGVHDTGSLRYVGERPTYDLVGLTTPDAAEAWRHGAGSVYELMENSPMRPDYFAIYPDAFSIPYLANTDLFGEELLLVNVPYACIASAEPVQGIWKADWSLANGGTTFYQPDILARTEGLELVDALDVADLADEAAHHVRWWQSQLRPGFPTEVHQLTYRAAPAREVIDGGRLLNGGLTFQTAAAQPGRPLWLVARLHAHGGGAVHVKVNGERVGRWAYPQVAGEWLETLFKIPAEAITESHTEITLEVDTDVPSFVHYAPYYLWMLQGEISFPEPEISRSMENVSFAGDLSLLGFDLPATTWAPGDVVPLTLYWRTARQTTLDAQVFVHLYDAEGGTPVTQADGWSYYGTRPPYTWFPGEIIEDPITLSLPEDIAPGDYVLKTGLYFPDGSGRLAVYQDGVLQEEDRVLLTTIEVR